ncbi:hypothetical protein L596_002389 [Steinernema carpocapsae]|nr:hypothetical protein L596_002389 [Steinernema carpocapsae]
MDSFDKLLAMYINSRGDRFTKNVYRESSLNCFDFIVQFFSFAKLGQFSKEEFTNRYVVRALQSALRYSTLAERVKTSGPIACARDFSGT